LNKPYRWYEEKKKGLGLQLLDTVQDSLRTIEKYPKLYPIRHADYRVLGLRRLPFSIFYTASDEEIIIVAGLEKRRVRIAHRFQCRLSQ